MTNLEEFTQDEFNAALPEILTSLLIDPRVMPSDSPAAVLLGGQSGAGKSTLHVILKEKFEMNVIVINGDEYRSAHPRFHQIQERYGIDAPAHTAAWAGAMVEALVDALSRQGYNLIIEGTLRTSAVPLKTAELLRGRGYRVDLALMAVKPEISLVSCQIRYEQMRIAGTTPRAMDPEHHAKIVDDIVGNLATLGRSDAFGSVALYNRAGTCLFSTDCPAPDAPASTALRDVLFGEWTREEEEHYATLQQQIGELQGSCQERPA